MILISETLDCVEVPIAGTRYQIFFELRRTFPERRRLQDLDMVVESALMNMEGASIADQEAFDANGLYVGTGGLFLRRVKFGGMANFLASTNERYFFL
jgi:hypothetical protein